MSYQNRQQPQNKSCPICGLPDVGTSEPGSGDWKAFNCDRCGDFKLTRTALQIALQLLKDSRTSPLARPALSHYIRRLDRSEWPHPMVGSDAVNRIVKDPRLPTARDQVANLILWLGDNCVSVGAMETITPESHLAVVGAADENGLKLVMEHLLESGLAVGEMTETLTEPARGTITLSIEGWEEYERLQREAPRSRLAFMAMAFGDPELDAIVNSHFRPAVANAGFELRRLDDESPAGLIDDRLRVEIRRSRFLIADLTHANNGAYWEAGFAEGLGKPVIYTCRQDIFEKEKPHFDTNHHLTIVWSTGELDDATTKLTATIRATLPGDARMEL